MSADEIMEVGKMTHSMDDIRSALEARRVELEAIIRPYAEEIFGIRRAILALGGKAGTAAQPTRLYKSTGEYAGVMGAIRTALQHGPLATAELKACVADATGARSIYPAASVLKSRGKIIRRGDVWQLAA